MNRKYIVELELDDSDYDPIDLTHDSISGDILQELYCCWHAFENIQVRETPTTECNMYDIIEDIPDCTVRLYKNSITGEQDIGWWRNDKPPQVIGGKK